ncbi:MAG: hypothetical protein E6I07_10710 [Chloroflexi bacterium]|nr:MAG: hypothetical protein E6I07_10710 [Chloroflexota bacterium]
MGSTVLLRAGPVAGILFVVLSIAGLVIHGYPANSRDAVRKWIATTDPTRFAIGIWLEGFAFMLFLVFAAWLLRTHRRPGVPRWPADVAMGSAVLATGSALLINGVWTAVLDAGRAGVESGPLYAVRVVAQDTFNATLFFYGFFALGVAVLTSVGHTLPRWLSWSAAAVGILMLIPLAASAAILAFYVWILAVTIVALRRRQEPDTQPAI